MAEVVQFPQRGDHEPELTIRQLMLPHPKGLGMSERWIRYRIKEGMPARRHWDNSYRLRLSECERWLEDRRRSA